MILSKGKHWIAIDPAAAKFQELTVQLNLAERYLHLMQPDTVGCDYWGLCRDNPEENTVVRLADGMCGNQMEVTYNDVMRVLPRLKQLMAELDLHPYIGKNYIGNWGIHRHAYSRDSKWNLCVMGPGNDPATVAFHEVVKGPVYEALTDTHIFDLLDRQARTRVIESLPVNVSDMYSFNTWVWHSHKVKRRDNHVECFLLHFKNADTQTKAIEVIKNGRRGIWRRTADKLGIL
jgi:hypothetical protein